jgi:hypothetical protein
MGQLAVLGKAEAAKVNGKASIVAAEISIKRRNFCSI